MRRQNPLLRSAAAMSIVAFLIMVLPATAQQERVLHSFNSNGIDGNVPAAGLIFDKSGNLYGTTQYGGAGSCTINGFVGCGTIFEMTPLSNGRWAEKVIYSFSNGTDGRYPNVSLIFDNAGNLYGTTQGGGAFGFGTAFELTRGAGGVWTGTILHSFNQDGTDGTGPSASLILDSSGNLYGSTPAGGANTSGIAFELSPTGGGNWSEAILHTFGCSISQCIDGYYPTGGLLFDSQGRLYGVTLEGGMFGGGTVFQLSPAGNGTWTETLLHGFGRAQDLIFPVGNLIFDSAGNLYGVDQLGGLISESGGGVFELIASTGGYGIEKILHNFNGEDAFFPEAGLVFDSSGNLYGTSVAGGIYIAGSLFRLTPTTSGAWTETILHNFGASNDGQNPSCALILDSSGNLYGTTAVGGQHGWGTVFEITP